MIVIHAVKKLLNVSRLEAPLMIPNPDPGQLMFQWYASLISTGFRGKLMIIYVHYPSLLTVICRSRTLQTSWKEFEQRINGLLIRHNFSTELIQTEIGLMKDYVVSKTNNRSMLAHMNQMIMYLEALCKRYHNYSEIQEDFLEDTMMNYLYQSGNMAKPYTTPIDYWNEKGVVRPRR